MMENKPPPTFYFQWNRTKFCMLSLQPAIRPSKMTDKSFLGHNHDNVLRLSKWNMIEDNLPPTFYFSYKWHHTSCVLNPALKPTGWLPTYYCPHFFAHTNYCPQDDCPPDDSPQGKLPTWIVVHSNHCPHFFAHKNVAHKIWKVFIEFQPPLSNSATIKWKFLLGILLSSA